MGLSSKQVSGDDRLDWSQALFKNGDMEIPKIQTPPGPGRQQRQATAAAAAPPLRCPRCDSSNTKFCYYNNYSRSQPRHFCKSCRRHWTNGGTLRNVPVGGGRKNKRPKTSHRTNSTTTTNSGHEQEMLQQLSTSYGPDIQFCQGLLQPSSSSSSPDYLSNNISSNGNILGSLLSNIPPVAPLTMTDPFFTTSQSYSLFPFMKQLDVESAEEDKIDISTSLADAASSGSASWQSPLLPSCGFANANPLEPSSTGGYWNCWDELDGFGTPQQNGVP